jgi:hypothetical protein
MVWIYERSNQSLHVETTFDNDTNEYLLLIRPDDGPAQTERFADASTYQARLESLERQLEADHWEHRSVLAMREGWRL